MATVLDKLEQIAKVTHDDVSHLLAKAFEVGVEHLWAQTQLDLYLRGQLSRDEAVKAVGAKLVEKAEQQRTAVLGDVRWGLGR